MRLPLIALTVDKRLQPRRFRGEQTVEHVVGRIGIKPSRQTAAMGIARRMTDRQIAAKHIASAMQTEVLAAAPVARPRAVGTAAQTVVVAAGEEGLAVRPVLCIAVGKTIIVVGGEVRILILTLKAIVQSYKLRTAESATGIGHGAERGFLTRHAAVVDIIHHTRQREPRALGIA